MAVEWLAEIAENKDGTCNVCFNEKYYKCQEPYDEIIRMLAGRRKIEMIELERLQLPKASNLLVLDKK